MADMGIIMDDAFFRERKSYFAIVRKMKSSLIRCPDGGGAKGGATVGLYQNGGYDESMSLCIVA